MLFLMYLIAGALSSRSVVHVSHHALSVHSVISAAESEQAKAPGKTNICGPLTSFLASKPLLVAYEAKVMRMGYDGHWSIPRQFQTRDLERLHAFKLDGRCSSPFAGDSKVQVTLQSRGKSFYRMGPIATKKIETDEGAASARFYAQLGQGHQVGPEDRSLGAGGIYTAYELLFPRGEDHVIGYELAGQVQDGWIVQLTIGLVTEDTYGTQRVIEKVSTGPEHMLLKLEPSSGGQVRPGLQSVETGFQATTLTAALRDNITKNEKLNLSNGFEHLDQEGMDPIPETLRLPRNATVEYGARVRA